MKSEEYYKKWEPISGIPSELYVEALHDDYEFFRVLLKGKSPQAKMLRIYFDSVYAYRNIDEIYRLRTWNNFKGERPSSLFIVENSKWLEWFHEESQELYLEHSIKHYAIHTVQDCIDILSEHEPLVEWLND
jgi:hypothetical protein